MSEIPQENEPTKTVREIALEADMNEAASAIYKARLVVNSMVSLETREAQWQDLSAVKTLLDEAAFALDIPEVTG